MQELRLAKEILVHIGPDQQTWAQFFTSRFTDLGMHGAFDKIDLTSYKDESSFEDPRFLLYASLSWISKFVAVPVANRGGKAPGHVIMDDWEAGPNDIWDVVERFKNTFCYDLRDKVYAVRSLEKLQDLGDGQKMAPIPVDYRISLPGLLIMLYEERYVLVGRAARTATSAGLRQSTPRDSFFARSKVVLKSLVIGTKVPDASGVIDSLDLDSAQCKAAAELATQRVERYGPHDPEVARRYEKVTKAIWDAYGKMIREREFNDLLLQGKAMITHMPPSVDQKLYWLGRQKAQEAAASVSRASTGAAS